MKTYYVKYILDTGVNYFRRVCIFKAEDESQAKAKFYKIAGFRYKSSNDVVKDIHIKELADDTIIDTPYV